MADQPVEPTLDTGALDGLVDAVGGDREFLTEVIEAYLADAATIVTALEAAAASRALESDARSGAVDDAAARVSAIRDELARVEPALLAARGEG